MCWWCLLDTVSIKKYALLLTSQLWQSTFSLGRGNRNSNKNPRSVWKRRQRKGFQGEKKRKRTERNAPYSKLVAGGRSGVSDGDVMQTDRIFFKDEPGKFLVGNLEMFAQCRSQERERSKRQRHTALSIRTFWESVSSLLWSEAEKWPCIFRSSQVYVMQWDRQHLERGYHWLVWFLKGGCKTLPWLG